MDSKQIAVEAEINVPVEQVWDFYNTPEHIINWNNASEDWHSPSAVNDLRVGGKFNYRMESKDGKEGFDFEGVYHKIIPRKLIEYTMLDERKVKVEFFETDGSTKITVAFDPEGTNPIDMQRKGWQAILDNFKRYAQAEYEKSHYE